MRETIEVWQEGDVFSVLVKRGKKRYSKTGLETRKAAWELANYKLEEIVHREFEEEACKIVEKWPPSQQLILGPPPKMVSGT